MTPAHRRAGRRWSRPVTLVLATGSALACCAAMLSGPVPVWAQEFDGAAGTRLDTATWQIMDLAGGWGNEELQAYTPRPQNVALDGRGNARITARREAWTDPEGNRARYTSARIESVEDFTYGRFEARIWVPVGQGLWSAFWTLGTEHRTVGWPAVGEIDIMELMNGTGDLHANVHAQEDRSTARSSGRWTAPGSVRGESPFGAGWHVYRLDWTADRLTWAVDGVEYHSMTRAGLERGQDWPFDGPQRILLNLAVGGRWPGPPDATTAFPATMRIDWVRVYDPSVIPG